MNEVVTTGALVGWIVGAIGLVGSIMAIVWGYHSHKRSRDKDAQDDGKNSGMILTEIGYIKSGVDDIKAKQSRQDDQHIEVITRLTSVEASAKQAHKRLDKVEGKPT